jgi:hypothetical protein
MEFSVNIFVPLMFMFGTAFVVFAKIKGSQKFTVISISGQDTLLQLPGPLIEM